MKSSFDDALARSGTPLKRSATTTLQVNVGLYCNMACRHCHLEAGPHRADEVMDLATARAVVELARTNDFATADITGGAPELIPVVPWLIENLAPHCPTLMLRSNLTALAEGGRAELLGLLVAHKVVVVASLPSSNSGQTDSMRGARTMEKSVEALRLLNSLGYGRPGSGLVLNLAANACGAFLPASQSDAERKFRADLARLAGIEFNSLFTFANAPLGRFRSWLASSGNLEAYEEKLASSFNPATVPGLMCRSLISISWDGNFYDCDFNQACDLPLGGRRMNVTDSPRLPAEGFEIATGPHCFACTAGAGFTCGGSIAA